MMIAPTMNPINGEVNKAIKTFSNPFKCITDIPDPIATAPTRAPIRACEELEGIPKYQVIRFQMLAPIRAARVTAMEIEFGEAISLPIVSATATPNTKGPMKFEIAAIINAAFGVIALDEMIVATTFALSLKPFRKSNIKANIIRIDNKIAGLI
jgi:hypothetical protein